MQDVKSRKKYFTTMSLTFAQSCTALATVMTEDIKVAEPKGIWSQTEYPALRQGSIFGRVNSIDAIHPDGKRMNSPLWIRNRASVSGQLEEEQKAKKEAEDAQKKKSQDRKVGKTPRDAIKDSVKSVDNKSAAKTNGQSSGDAVEKPDAKKPAPDESPDSSRGTSCSIGRLGLEADFDAGGKLAVDW
jgi:hypothetical protein